MSRVKLTKLLHDTPATKGLWRYVADRYGETSSFYVYDDLNLFVDKIKANTGINQGDVAALLLFDIFVSDATTPVGDIFQIHDDTYVACNPGEAREALTNLILYAERKGLHLNLAKTKILAPSAQLVSDPSLRCFVTSAPTKIGGVYIQAQPTALDREEINAFLNYGNLLSLPHQHIMVLLHFGLKPKWKYATEALTHELATPLVNAINSFQRGILQHILMTTSSNTIPPIEDQLVEDPHFGGLGFFKYSDERERILAATPNKQRKNHAVLKPKTTWFNELNEAAKESLTFPFPLVTCIPTDRCLRVDDYSYSAYIATRAAVHLGHSDMT